MLLKHISKNTWATSYRFFLWFSCYSSFFLANLTLMLTSLRMRSYEDPVWMSTGWFLIYTAVMWAAYLLALQGLSEAFRDSCYLSEFVRFAEAAVFSGDAIRIKSINPTLNDRKRIIRKHQACCPKRHPKQQIHNPEPIWLRGRGK